MSRSGKSRPPLVADKRYGTSGSKAAGGKPKAAPKKAAKPKATARRKTSAKKPARRRNPIAAFFGGIFSWIFRLIWGFTWRFTAVLVMLIGLGIAYYYASLPDARDLVDGRTRGSVTLLDRDGQVFAWRGDQFGGVITADTVSPHLKNAVIATEDKRFYRHFGISPRGVAGAMRINMREGRGPLSGHGGSTITQQTAKLLCFGTPYDPESGQTEAEYESECRRGTIARKVKEAIYAMAMEAKYSKDEILTIYLNRAYLGAGSRGFEAASQRYFGKSANEVDAAEAAMLAGLLTAPSRFAPTNNLQRSQDRANVIVGLMQDQGYLSVAEADYARTHPAELSDAAQARAGGYFADWVMDSGPSFLTRDTTEDVIIRTTFDQRIQKAAEGALQYIFEEKVREGSKAEAAIVIMSADGAVRAMVGGRKTKVSGAFNRATQALRQTGSAFKPFVYAAALDLGYTPLDTILDAPLTINVPGSGAWSPKNYSREFYGEVTLTESLAKSLNTSTVRLSEAVGRENVSTVARDFGLENDLAPGPAIALGTSETTLIEMTGAYAGILNGGRSVEPYGIMELRLQGDDAPLSGQDGGMGERVISETAAGGLIYMMNKVIEQGTGQRARLGERPAAGKTGTSQSARDAWFIGFTADYVAGIWMGYDDNTPLTGVTGGGLPAEIWRETMVRVHEGVPVSPLPMIVPSAPAKAPAVAQQQKRKQNPANVAEQVILEVLGTILGGN
ncbi:transglycosylase domain-containing protein [Pseudoruegeria sp. SHC-113]|uniref:transglycosylase domain-containing protein n=1 Tax=Pseudoruegeria sp. SHC-113 TaxID=2855439 RepID=UPI0021BB66DA|nr:PBP1A family penicillin-binding protein [Pseudoruegeria sp. SHC-113]MCT8159114.1 PBP1A family penicillin-binding protein [Pseudoruegeria sp. SHC-113]